jgi:hypothetical protein
MGRNSRSDSGTRSASPGSRRALFRCRPELRGDLGPLLGDLGIMRSPIDNQLPIMRLRSRWGPRRPFSAPRPLAAEKTRRMRAPLPSPRYGGAWGAWGATSDRNLNGQAKNASPPDRALSGHRQPERAGPPNQREVSGIPPSRPPGTGVRGARGVRLQIGFCTRFTPPGMHREDATGPDDQEGLAPRLPGRFQPSDAIPHALPGGPWRR